MATDHLSPEGAAACRADYDRARKARPELRFRRFLRDGDYVSPEVLEEFVGDDELVPRSGLGVVPAPTGVEALLEEAVPHDDDSPAARRSGSRPVRLEAPPPRGDVTDEDSTQRVEREVLARASARTLKELATPGRLAGDEGTSRFDGSTKRFDADALAAASQRHGAPGALLALLVGGALVAGGGVLMLVYGGGAEPAIAVTPGETDPLPSEVVTPDRDPPPEATPGQEEQRALAAQLRRATQLQETEDYQGALQVLATLAPKLRVAHTERIKTLEAELRAAAAFRREADRALAFLDELNPEAQRNVGLEQLQAALAEQPGPAAKATALRLEARIAELKAPLPEPGPAERDPEAEPPERTAYYAKLGEQGRSVVEALRRRIDEEQAARADRSGAAVDVARARTERKPLRLSLPSGYRIDRGTIVGMDDAGMTVADGADRIPVSWDVLSPKQAYTLRRLAVRDDEAEDHLKLGVWCLTQRQFDAAREAFGRAIELDAGLRQRIPSVNRIEAEGQVFGGRLDRRGGTIKVDYRFTSPEEFRDWQAEVGSQLKAGDGRIEVAGQGMFLAGLKEVGFEDQVTVEVGLGAVSKGSQVLCGLLFSPGTADEKAYLVGLSARGQPTLLVRKDRHLRKLARSTTPIKGDTLRIVLRDNRLKVRSGARDLINQKVSPTWDGVRVLLGGLAVRKTDPGTADYTRVVVQGRVRIDWLRKAFGALDDLLQGSLDALDELPVFRRPRGTLAPPDLSAEDAFGMRDVPDRARAEYARGVEAWNQETADGLAQANQAFDRAVELAPRFAAALYRRGLARERLGRTRLALADAEDALEACPHFYEAETLISRLLRVQGRLEDALAAATRALETRPDYADARLSRGAILFAQGDLQAALTDLELANALNPWDETARRLRRNVATVLAGPSWSKRSFSVESKHFVVETDTTHDRAEGFLEQLEAVHAHYGTLFGVDPNAERPRSKVLIFDTREGFLSYAALSTNDRVESLLGCYLPRYRQLLLFEDKNATEEQTLRVLFHEGFHQFIDPVVPELPLWLNEGLAEFFSTLRVERDGVRGEGGPIPSRSRDLARFLAQGGPVPFEQLMNQTPGEFYSGPVAFKYAQAWSMVRFFLDRRTSPDLRKRFLSYLSDLRGGASPRRAFLEAWDGTDWRACEAEWRKSLE
ncbi:MAG: tetratricopeptide repeat protein [Planctomycetota bacterium]